MKVRVWIQYIDTKSLGKQHKLIYTLWWHRLALYCFMWDTQHAVLFCQSLCMSAFELRLHFPCSQAVWEAPDAASWGAA